jgi:CDC6, C terminal winged helix domain
MGKQESHNMTANQDKFILGKQEKRRILYTLMEQLFGVGKEVRDFSARELAETIDYPGMAQDRVKDYLQEMEEMGIISRRYEYGSKSSGMSVGRHYHMTILMDKEEALAILDIADREELRKFHVAQMVGVKKALDTKTAKAAKVDTDKTAVRYEKDEPVEAIAGPEAQSAFEALRPLRKDEPRALIEAARQYRDRTHGINSKIEDVIATAKELGISINESALRESVPVETDDRLETICLILPYIDELERVVELNIFAKPKAGVASKTAN